MHMLLFIQAVSSGLFFPQIAGGVGGAAGAARAAGRQVPAGTGKVPKGELKLIMRYQIDCVKQIEIQF